MPYENQFASGESLLKLEQSEAFRRFEGMVAERASSGPSEPAQVIDPIRRRWIPRYVIAIDGSNISHRVRNGFPGAEASIVMLSVLFIDISKLIQGPPSEILRPRIFHEMERVQALDAVLPGANIVRKSRDQDSPKEFFRESVFDAFSGHLDRGHETLISTLASITASRAGDISCPIQDCGRRVTPGSGRTICPCEKKKPLFETDALRFHERFNEIGTNGEVHGEVRHVLEILAMLNIMRFFAVPDRARFFLDTAFVLDGPLAVFGQPAWIMPYVRAEIGRINEVVRASAGSDVVLFGVEKTGVFMNHFHDIDWTDNGGPRSRYPAGTVIAPDTKYIHRNIVFRPDDAKPYGDITYFGRKILYKTSSSSHTVINSAIVNEAGLDLSNVSLDAFPRLGDILDVMDQLSTYLYQDGFMPLVRAHAHAAIPLEKGARLLEQILRNDANS